MNQNLRGRLRDLLRLLEDLHALHGELLETVNSKVAALRGADREALAAIVEREGGLIERVQERESCRRLLMDQIGRELGMSGPQARKLTASQLAVRLDQAGAAKLMLAAQSLRGVAVQLSKANRMAGAISREMVKHFERIFESVRQTGCSALGYAHNGNLVSALEHKLVDAVG